MSELIVTGDSWTFGSEIRDPSIFTDNVNIPDWDDSNDNYRIPRIWPTLLKNKLKFSELKNLAFPAASNDRAIRVLINYITEKYLSKNKSTDDVFVVIGLTSPERRDFYYKDETKSNWITLWPAWEHKYDNKNIVDFSKMYISYFWNEQEFLNRYLNQILYLQSFLKSYNIKYLIFQSFYQPQQNYDKIEKWVDNPYVNMWNTSFHGSSDTIETKYYMGSSERQIWELVDSVRFMNKEKDIHSFHGFLTQVGQWSDNSHKDYNMLHPNENGHLLWANELKNYILDNNLYRKI